MIGFSERIRLCRRRALIEMTLEHFWFPEPVGAMLMQYYWQRLEVGIAAGCTISVILFV